MIPTRVKMLVRELLASRNRAYQVAVVTQFKKASNIHQSAELFKAVRGQPISSLILGSLTPRSIADIRPSRRTTAFSGEMLVEFNWLCARFVAFSTEVISHLKLADRYSREFYLGNYNACWSLLAEHRCALGETFWAIEKEFILREIKDGLAGNTAYLQQIEKQVNEGLTPFIAYYISAKTQQRTSLQSLASRIESLKTASGEAGATAHFRDYVSLHVLHYDPPRTADLAVMLFLLGSLSLIDSYRLFIRLYVSFSRTRSEDLPKIHDLISELWRTIGDGALLNIQLAVHGETPPLVTSTHAGIVQDYLCENYPRVIEATQRSILGGNACFDEYLLAAKSLVYTKQQVDVFGLPFESPSEYLLSLLHEMNLSEPFDADTFGALEWAVQVSADANVVPGIAEFMRAERLATRPVTVITRSQKAGLTFPGSLGCIRNVALHTRLPDSARSALTTHSSLSTIPYFFLSPYTPESLVDPPADLPGHRSLRWKAQVEFLRGRSSESVALLKNLVVEHLLHSNVPILTARHVIRDFVDFAVHGGLPQEALSLIVNLLLEKRFPLPEASVSALATALSAPARIHQNESIELPILLALGGATNKTIYYAYRSFLASLKLSTPRELISADGFALDKRSRCFLERVCSQDVLAESLHFASTDDLETERLAICDFLKRSIPDAGPAYDDEIQRLTKAIAIRRGLQRVAESKIYVDEDGLREARSATYSDLLSRVRDAAAFDRMGLIPVSASDVLPNVSNELKKTKLYLVSTPGFSAFKETFAQVRDDFALSNEFGLDSYLSVRVRHGVLLGQLRRPFEEQQLITRRSSAGDRYFVNEFWERAIGSDETANAAVQSMLSKLSADVDNVIAMINTQWLRATNKKLDAPESRFDYEFTDVQLLKLFETIDLERATETEFYDAIFEALWRRTEENLSRVRVDFQTTVLPRFLQAISEIQIAIHGIDTSADWKGDMLNKLAKNQTEIQHEIERVTAWFSLKEAEPEGTFVVTTAVTIALEIIKYLNPKTVIAETMSLVDVAQIPSRHFVTFVDICLLLFANAVKHSGLAEQKLKLDISGSSTNEAITVTVANAVAVDATAAAAAIATSWAQAQAQHRQEVVRSEKGSGFYKLYSLVRYNLAVESFVVEVPVCAANEIAVKLSIPFRFLCR